MIFGDLRRYELWSKAMGEEVGEAEGEAQRRDAGDHQVRHDPTQVQVPEAEFDLGTLHYLGI